LQCHHLPFSLPQRRHLLLLLLLAAAHLGRCCPAQLLVCSPESLKLRCQHSTLLISLPQLGHHRTQGLAWGLLLLLLGGSSSAVGGAGG
jgi:hypothetical protein